MGKGVVAVSEEHGVGGFASMDAAEYGDELWKSEDCGRLGVRLGVPYEVVPADSEVGKGMEGTIDTGLTVSAGRGAGGRLRAKRGIRFSGCFEDVIDCTNSLWLSS